MLEKEDPKSAITEQLKRWGEIAGTDADADLLNLVYEELHRQAHRYMKQERVGHTLQTTALVHEAYLKLARQRTFPWQNRSQFYGIAASMMRRILIDHARSANRLRRGGSRSNLPLDTAITLVISDERLGLLELDEALERLARRDMELGRIVELRFFAGLDVPETAAALGVSESTVKRGWVTAKAWLHRELNR